MEIFKPNSATFEFNKISLATPQPLQGSSYFTKINFGENNLPLYIQLPKCLTKQAIIAAKRGKYCDLMYERNTSNDEFIEWIEGLESICRDKIDEKKQLWFQNEFTRDEIDTMMTPIARMYKSGKYVLIRAHINENKYTGKDKCIVYNENEVNVEIDSITEESYIIPLILIDGIKFTSRSFEIDIKIIQMMVLDKAVPEMTACLIKKSPGTVGASASVAGASVAGASVAGASVAGAIGVIGASAKGATDTDSIPNTIPNTIPDNDTIPDNTIPDNTIPDNTIPDNTIPNNTIPNNTKKDYLENISISQPSPPPTPSLSLLKEEEIQYPLEKPSIEEIQINYETIADTIILKKPNEVYYEQYRIAKQKALEMREAAINAILEAKNIITKYNLVDEDSDLDEDF